MGVANLAFKNSWMGRGCRHPNQDEVWLHSRTGSRIPWEFPWSCGVRGQAGHAVCREMQITFIPCRQIELFSLLTAYA